MVTGKIRTLRVDKGFGFIKDDSGKEYFFHQSAVYGEGLDNLREGDSVEFDVGQGPSAVQNAIPFTLPLRITWSSPHPALRATFSLWERVGVRAPIGLDQ